MIYGAGILDADYVVQKKESKRVDGKRYFKQTWICPYYVVWSGMIKRCYGGYIRAYENVSVCPDWLIFSKFKAWMEEQEWEGKCLDKDLLVVGNKVYSPNTCIFIDAVVNKFIMEHVENKEEWPTGGNF